MFILVPGLGKHYPLWAVIYLGEYLRDVWLFDGGPLESPWGLAGGCVPPHQQTPCWCTRIQLNSDAIYPEIVSDSPADTSYKPRLLPVFIAN